MKKMVPTQFQMSKSITRSVLKRIESIQSKELLIQEIAEVTGTKESEVRQHFHDVKTKYYAAGSYLSALLLFWGTLFLKRGPIVLESASGQADLVVLAISSLFFPWLMVMWRNISRPY